MNKNQLNTKLLFQAVRMNKPNMLHKTSHEMNKSNQMHRSSRQLLYKQTTAQQVLGIFFLIWEHK